MVLSGSAPETLLDSYGPERLAHVVALIHQTVEIGNFICISDPEAAAKRDAMMVAVAADPSLEPKRSPLPKLGTGISLDGDPHGGELSFQGLVEVDGKVGLFDDLVGDGFSLVGTMIDCAAHLSPSNRAWFDRLGGVVAQVTPNGTIRDVAGNYARFFGEKGVGAVLSRPDFNIFGTARRDEDINGRLPKPLPGKPKALRPRADIWSCPRDSKSNPPKLWSKAMPRCSCAALFRGSNLTLPRNAGCSPVSLTRRRVGVWHRLILIYLQDSLRAAIPEQRWVLDSALLSTQRPSYRFMSYLAAAAGHKVDSANGISAGAPTVGCVW